MTRLRLIFCHGLGAAPRDNTSHKIQQWAEQNQIPAYVLNYQNYGKSDYIWNINDWRRDIIKALTEDENVKTVIVGSSGGCQAVLRAALDAPEAIAGLLLFSPGVGISLDYMECVLPGSVEKLQNGEILRHPAVDPSLDIKVDLDNLMEFVNVSN